MEAKESSTNDRLHDPGTLLRFAITAQLDAYDRRLGGTGRQALGRALDLKEPAVSALLSPGQRPSKLVKLAQDMEDLGFARRESVTRLARELHLDTARWGIEARWWPHLREVLHLGDATVAPSFRSARDAVLAAEAFASHYRRVLEQAPNVVERRLPAHEVEACRQLITALCWFATGPYGVSRDAVRLVAILAPLEPEVLQAFVRGGGTASQMVRAFDPSDGPVRWNSRTRSEFADLLANPPDRLFRRVFWIRSLRRLRQSDFEHQATPPEREWIAHQLEHAIRGELTYRGARLHERQYALWCAAEIVPGEAAWARLRKCAEEHPELAALVPTAERMRVHLAALPLHRRDGYQYTPQGGWPARSGASGVLEMLDSSRVETSRWSQHGNWRWAKVATRLTALRLLRDCIIGPCAVRERWALGTLRAGGIRVRESSACTINDVFAAEIAATHPNQIILERCLAVLGVLGVPQGAPTVEDALRNDPQGSILAQAVSTTGDLAHRDRVAATGARAWAMARVAQAPLDEELAIVAIHAAVACRDDPRLWIGGQPPTLPAVAAMLQWADRVLKDRNGLLPDAVPA